MLLCLIFFLIINIFSKNPKIYLYFPSKNIICEILILSFTFVHNLIGINTMDLITKVFQIKTRPKKKEDIANVRKIHGASCKNSWFKIGVLKLLNSLKYLNNFLSLQAIEYSKIPMIPLKMSHVIFTWPKWVYLMDIYRSIQLLVFSKFRDLIAKEKEYGDHICQSSTNSKGKNSSF